MLAGNACWVLLVHASVAPAPRLLVHFCPHQLLISLIRSLCSLEGITKRFKFTAVKQAPGTAAGGSGARSKAERKAAAAGAARKGER